MELHLKHKKFGAKCEVIVVFMCSPDSWTDLLNMRIQKHVVVKVS